MRKGMEFEMMAKATLAIVIVVVGISLVSTFLGEDLDVPGKMKRMVVTIVTGSYNDADPKLDKINEEYTSKRIAELIFKCYERTLDSSSDMPCYILEGNFTNVDKNSILRELSKIEAKVGSRTNMTSDFSTTDLVLIYYDSTDKIIDIRD